MVKKIKYYGFMDMTKKQYLIAQGVTFLILAVLWLWLIFGTLNELLFGFGTVLLLFVTAAEATETYIILNKFDAKEQ